MKNNYLIVVTCLFLFPFGINTSLAQSGPEFQDCADTISLCVDDEGVRLPANNKFFLGEENPDATSCSVHVSQKRKVRSTCGKTLRYEVQLFLYDTSAPYILQPPTYILTDSLGEAEISFDSELSPEVTFKENGIPFTTGCYRYHRIEWIVKDSCGTQKICEIKLDLYDCKVPKYNLSNDRYTAYSPFGLVLIDLDTMVVDLLDDCSERANFLFSLSPDQYQPDSLYDMCNIPAWGVELPWPIWIADEGRDYNCNGIIEWKERTLLEEEIIIVFVSISSLDCGEFYFYLIGEITTEDVQTVEKVTVTLTSPGHVFPTYITDGDGKYKFDNIIVPAEYSISVERNDDHRNGVSTLDLFRIQKHILGKEMLSNPYDLIAADANNNLLISAVDLVELRKLILGIYTELPNNKSWRFVDKKFQFTDPKHPWPFDESIDIANLTGALGYQDFIAIKIGDVNNTVVANIQAIDERSSREKIKWFADQKEFKANEYFDINISLNEKIDLQGFQFTLSDPDLEFIDAYSSVIDIDESSYALFDDKMTFSWFDESGIKLSDDDIIFTVKARAKKDGSLKHNLSINSDITEAEVYSMSDEILSPELAIPGDNTHVSLMPEPNPWKESTSISFSLLKAGEVNIEILDLNGHRIYSRNEMMASGENKFLVSSDQFTQRGLLFYSITTGAAQYSGKMIVLE